MGFFDEYPAFFGTSNTGATPNRLNKRHRAIFESDPGAFAGATILDMASHDGRWSFAAVKAGGAHVTGVEPRRHLIEEANRSFLRYGVPNSAYEFAQDDVFNYLRRTKKKFGVMLCLGFFYHTYRHPELLALIKRLNPEYLIVDSQIVKTEGLVCGVRKDRVDAEFEAYQEESTYRGMTYVAMPSMALLKDMLSHFRFELFEVEWPALIGDDARGVEDYADGRRATLICRAM